MPARRSCSTGEVRERERRRSAGLGASTGDRDAGGALERSRCSDGRRRDERLVQRTCSRRAMRPRESRGSHLRSRWQRRARHERGRQGATSVRRSQRYGPRPSHSRRRAGRDRARGAGESTDDRDHRVRPAERARATGCPRDRRARGSRHSSRRPTSSDRMSAVAARRGRPLVGGGVTATVIGSHSHRTSCAR